MDELLLIPVIVAFGALTAVAALAGAWWLIVGDDGGSSRELPPALSPLRDQEPPGRIVMALQALSAPDDEESREELRRAMIQGGMRGSHALERMLALRTVLTIGLPGLTWYLADGRFSPTVAFFMLLAAGVGYFTPLWVARSAQADRQLRLSRAVPNVMDMLVSCLEAGLGIDAALQYAAREIRVASFDLAEELDLTNAEMAAGIPRMSALHRLDERTGVKELSSLINVLGQAEKYGAGAAQAIRAQARLSRQRRTLDAERRAAEAAPKLTVAMILFILPALFVVLLGPSAVKVIQGLNPGSGW
jgi:tight adherence protein C